MYRNIAIDWVRIKFENLCYRCGEEILDSKDMHIDHVVDASYGEEEYIKNFANVEFLRASHSTCNLSQGDIVKFFRHSKNKDKESKG